jgi:hypothetical protein
MDSLEMDREVEREVETRAVDSLEMDREVEREVETRAVDSLEMDNEEADSAPMTFNHPGSPSKDRLAMPHRSRQRLG